MGFTQRAAATAAVAGTIVLAGGLASPVGAVEVFNTDFESGIPAAFSAPGCVVEGVQGYAGLGTTGNQFGGSFLRYTTVSIVDTKLTLRNLPPHNDVTISFLLAVIDSWDGTELLKVSVDGTEVFSHWFQLATGDASSYVAPPGGLLSSGTNLGFSSGSYYARDRAYDLSVEPAFISIPHTADSLIVVWHLGAVSGGAAQNWQGGGDESWAIDNMRVSVSGTPTRVGDVPAPNALALGHNAPNPFQATTILRVSSARPTEAQVDIIDVTGRRVRRELVALSEGWQDVVVQGVDDRSRPLPSGVYFCRVRAGGETATRKIIVAR
jgi:hypothetical protein